MKITIKKQRVDWFKVLNDLKTLGYTLREIDKSIGIPKSTLLGYKQGAEPKHDDGELLIAFWCEAVKAPRESLPKLIWSGNRPKFRGTLQQKFILSN